MSATGPGTPQDREPTEEELRAAYEAQIKQLRVEHILLDNVVAMINIGMRRTGLAPGTESERDVGQVRLAIECVRALMPQLEQVAPGEVGQIRNALSQLQLAFVQIGGQPSEAAGPGAPAGEPAAGGPPPGGPPPAGGPPPGGAGQTPAPGEQPPRPGEPGPAQKSGRLWVPGR